jgi:hypothetical protein
MQTRKPNPHQSKPTNPQTQAIQTAKQPVSHQPIKPTALASSAVLLLQNKSLAPNRLAGRKLRQMCST